MKIKTFDPKEFNLVEILKKESNKTAIDAFLHCIAKYPSILGNFIVDFFVEDLIIISTTIFPSEVDVSSNKKCFTSYV